jgi:hypothetical protein
LRIQSLPRRKLINGSEGDGPVQSRRPVDPKTGITHLTEDRGDSLQNTDHRAGQPRCGTVALVMADGTADVPQLGRRERDRRHARGALDRSRRSPEDDYARRGAARGAMLFARGEASTWATATHFSVAPRRRASPARYSRLRPGAGGPELCLFFNHRQAQFNYAAI